MSETDSTKHPKLWDVPPERKCWVCKRFKPLTDFRVLNGKYGRRCSYCVIEVRRDAPEKKCSRCKVVKKRECFNSRKCGDLLQNYCIDCANTIRREKSVERKRLGLDREYNKNQYNRYHREKHLKRKYGVDLQQYEAMLAAQDGLCAICGKPEVLRYKGTLLRLAVDHDHQTGAIRGLLCRRCNQGIGLFCEDAAILRSAMLYLKRAAKN